MPTVTPTSNPTTNSPMSSNPTLSPSSIHPTTSNPTTVSPSGIPTSLIPTQGPFTALPTSLHPLTGNPLSLGPSSSSPATLTPTTLTPWTLMPTMNPTLHPLTNIPTSLCPSTSSPITSSPFTFHPFTHIPSFAPTATPSSIPLTKTPTSLNPLSVSPLTLTPVTHSPTDNPTESPTLHPSIAPSTNPTTLVPTTVAPLTQHPATESPTSFHPSMSSLNPTSTPVSESPTTNFPVSSAPVTTITKSPSTSLPSRQPTLSPATWEPTTGPTTCNPITRGPTLAQIQGYWIYPDSFVIAESYPPWAANMDLSGGRGRAMFAVQNLLPKTQTLTISCIYKKDKNNTSDRSLIELKLNGEISINGDAHKVVLGNEDPTKYICQRDNQNNALVTNISCNGRYLLSIDRKVESEDCNADGLLRLGVVTPTPDGSGKLEQTSNVTRNTFVCPHPCFSGHNAELTETCSSISNQNSKSSISIYEIQSLYQPPRIHKNKNSTSSSSKASVKCDFRSSLGGSGSLSLGVTVLKTRWPSIRDFLIEVEPGVLLSARGQAGSTSELLRYHSDEESGDGEKSLYTLPLPPYLVTLHTRTKITAIADFHGRFEAGDALSTSNSDTRKSVCPKVFIGGETAEVVSCSASNVTFFAPYFKDVCRLKDSNISRDSCGYQRVVIQNVDKFDAGELIAGGRIECPGSCPLSGLGFNYVSKCLNYESPTKCSSLTNPPDNCAYGAGDKCQDCPKTAVCPGGFRMWPRRGYWTSSEKAGTVFQCSAPPFERCLGWDIVNEMSKCGRAYDGVLCAECSDGYYEKLNICEACPDRQTRIAKIGLLIACMFVIYIIIYICLKYSRIERDGLLYNISKKDLRELIRWQAKDFVIWCMLVFQLLTLVIVSSGASAPELQQLIVWAGVASLNFQAVGPECFDNTAEAFVKEYTIFPVVIVAISIFFVLPRLQYSNSNIRRSKIRSRGYPLLRNLRLSEESVQSIRSKLISLLVFLYTPSTFLSVGITYCIESNNEEGKTVLVSWQNPNFECGGTTHLPVMTLGAACLILHTVGFPLWTWYINRSVISNADKLNNESRSNTNLSVFISTSQNIERDVQIRAKAWKRFFGDDYLPQYHWFVNVQMLLAFILCCTRVYFSNYTDREQIAKMCVNVIAVSIFGVLLVVLRPFVKHMEW
eukprot:CAMPEP_0114505504 /NCGR_PEP_ID=MMETSP0109-20121206/10891_1 /TAXON_ID=29199 /ORGANISM="Chlorarachnion reptans, Strain CCCM449" /LENGTH=1166 /DNA_ID=CAMNT_0001683953 /DNA_START=48 /DNA_END=3545 /DNA_ORIENTATION=+